MASKLRTPFAHGQDGNTGLTQAPGGYNSHKLSVVNKPADLGSGDIPRKFYHSGGAMEPKVTSALRSPFDHAMAKGKK